MKKALTLALALVLMVCLSAPAFAAGTPPTPTDKHQTTVGIQVYDYDPAKIADSVSFTVPLYITLAVTKDTAQTPVGSKIIVPGTGQYKITNTTPSGGSDIAVSQLVVAAETGAAWTLVPAAPADNQLTMSLGTGGNLLALTPGTITTGGFITAPPAKPSAAAKIAPQGNLMLDIAATIQTNKVYTKAAAAPQFTLKYTLQPLDSGGNFVNAANITAYVGDNKAAAGYP
ncbi:MAG: hypothetical protein RSD27_01115 [Ruthenibacterium sp.]